MLYDKSIGMMISVLNPTTERNGFKVLLVEDNWAEAEVIEELLLQTNVARSLPQSLSVSRADRLSKAQQLLVTEKFDVILLDLSLPDSQDLSTIVKIQEYSLNTPIVVLTARNDEELAVQSIQTGAQDYLVKTKIDSEVLMRSLRYAIERQHNQEALQKSEAKYRSVVENSLVGIAILDAPTSPSEPERCEWLEVNDALCDLLGYEREELMQKNWAILSFPEDRQATFDELNKILAGASEGYVLDKRWRKKNGKIVYTRVSLRCIRSPDGAIDRMIKVILDVSDRYRYEFQFKTSEEFLKHTINATPDPIFVKDEQHRWVVLNDAFCELMGKPRSELIGKSRYDFLPSAKAEVFEQKDEEVLRTGIPVETEEKFTDSVGKERVISTKRSVFQTIDNSKMLVGKIRDVTELKQTQQDRDRFFGISLDLLCIAGLDGYFKRLNPAWSNVLGHTTAEFLAKPFIEFVHPEDQEKTIAELETLKHGNPVINLENRYICQDGTYKWLSWTVSPFTEEGLIYAVARDVTLNKQAEAELRKSERFAEIIAAASPNILYVYDLIEHKVIYANASIVHILGYTVEEIQEMKVEMISRLMHPEDLIKMPDYLQQVETGAKGDIFEIEYRMQHKNGSWRWIVSRDTVFMKTAEGQLKQILGAGTDITESKQTEDEIKLLLAATQAISQSADFDRALADVLRLLCNAIGWNFAEAWIPSADGTVLEQSQSWYASDRDLEAFGRESKDFVFAPGVGVPGRIWVSKQMEWREDISTSLNPIFLRAQIAAKSGLKTCFGIPIRADGKVLAVLVFYQRNPLTIEGRIVELVNAVATQLGSHIQRKKAEEELRKSEERWQLVLKGNQDGIWDFNLKTNEVFRSARWKEIIGYADSEIDTSNSTWTEQIHPEDASRVQAAIQDYLDRKTPNYAAEYRLLCKDGSYKWVLARAQAVWDKAGNPLRMVGSMTDISDRKQAELELLKVTQAVESTSDAIAITDLKGRSIYHNQAFIQRYGYTVEELNLINAAKAMYVQPKIYKQIYKTICSGLSWSDEIELKTKHGEKVITLVRADNIKDDTGNFIGSVGVITDITERKQAEAALQLAKESAEAANRAKSDFLANMSHELRTPLNGILGYIQLLKPDRNLTTEQQESLNNAQQCGDHLLTLINDVLDLAKIEADKMELSLTEMNLSVFIKSIVNLFQMRSDQKGITFNFEQISPLPSWVFADEKRLRQILINLLSNAVKFTNLGGVTLKVGYMENFTENSTPSGTIEALPDITAPNLEKSPTTKIRFQIEDTGIGIGEHKLAEIFLPFHQVGDRHNFVEGTGLGLSISQKLVKMMGGKIHVQSTSGKGSIFWLDIDLPAAPQCSEVPPPPEKQRLIAFVGLKRKVLLVDDNEANRAMLNKMLSRLGFEIVQATDGEDCLHKALEFQPDLILMDLLMPVMDGWEATKRLRHLPELKDTVILALSASVDDTTRQESILAGCNGFLTKPIQTNELLESLRVHLGLEWVYEDGSSAKKRKAQTPKTSSDLTAADSAIVSPASESVLTLLRLSSMGDIEAILEEIAKLENSDQKLAPFAHHVRQLAKGFQLKQIRVFLKQHLS